jgi:hypothetical protein
VNGDSYAWYKDSNAVYTHSSGKIDFTKTGVDCVYITGGGTFFNFEISVSSYALYYFTAGDTITIANSGYLTLTGAASPNLLEITNDEAASCWLLNRGTSVTTSIQYADVHWSDASGSAETIMPGSTCVDGGDNINWLFNSVTPVWNAPATGNWSDAVNWTDLRVPEAGEAVTFNSTSIEDCSIILPTAVIGSITITADYTGTIYFYDNINVGGAVSIADQCALAETYGIVMSETANLSCELTLPLLTINGSGKTITLTSGLVATTIVITAGTLDTGANIPLTCTGDATEQAVTIATNGILTTHTSTLILGGAYNGNWGLAVNGTFTGGNGAHTISCITMNGVTASATLTSATTILDAMDSAGRPISIGTGTWSSPGLVQITWAATVTWYSASDLTFHDLEIGAGATLKPYSAVQPGHLICTGYLLLTGSLNTINTSVTSRNVTVTEKTTVFGTLTCNASTCSFGSEYTTEYAVRIANGGVFAGGTGTHTMGSCGCGVLADNETNTVTLTSGTMTVDAKKAATDIAFWTSPNTTFSHPTNGTIVFNHNTNQLLYDMGNTARTFYNLTVNNASSVVRGYNGAGFAITITNLLTITAGIFDTSDLTAGTSRNLTVSSGANI